MTVAILCGLAAWRISRLALNEEGPFRILARARALVGVPSEGQLRGPLVGLLTCMYCATVWAATAMWLCWQYLAEWPVVILAAAAVAVIVESWRPAGGPANAH